MRRCRASHTPLLLFAAALLACATNERRTLDPDPISRPVVDRLDEEVVRIRWPAAYTTGPVTVYAGPSPDAIDRSRPVGAGHGGSLTLHASDEFPEIEHPKARLYYELRPATGDPVITAERRLPLEGADNFRDLGGYETVDGRSVRWGQLYRSNQLSGLSDDDVQYLSAIGLRVVCDFRTERVQREHPDRVLPPEPPETLSLPVNQEGVEPDVVKHKIRTGGITALGIEATLVDAYRAFVTEHSATWAALFQRISQPGSLPALVHCTAGKDRTGFASALVLLSLGVPEETVYEDYLLTNHYRAAYGRFVLRWAPLYSLFRTQPEDLLPLLEARREYLDSSFEAIEELHGSVDAYLEEELGVTPTMRASLQARLLR